MNAFYLLVCFVLSLPRLIAELLNDYGVDNSNYGDFETRARATKRVAIPDTSFYPISSISPEASPRLSTKRFSSGKHMFEKRKVSHTCRVTRISAREPVERTAAAVFSVESAPRGRWVTPISNHLRYIRMRGITWKH